MAEVRLSERVTPFVGAQVDEDAGVIRGAVICGLASLNGGDYSPKAFGTCTQYEGKKSFTNHSKAGRQVEELLGWWQDCKPRADGRPEGDFHFLKSHPMAARVIEIAKRNPALIGFSHVAVCETGPKKGGRFAVEQVKSVESIDLVADPATNPRGLFESYTGGRPVKVTLKALAESLGADAPAGLVKLAESHPAVETDAHTDPAAAHTGAAVAVAESLSAQLAAALTKLTEADEALAEAKRQTEAVKEAKAALLKAGLKTPTDEQADIYAGLKPTLREGYVADLLRAAAPPAEKPTSVTAGAGVRRTEEAKAPPTDPAGFKKFVTEAN